MLITLSHCTVICQSVAEVQLTPLGAVSHRFNFNFLIKILMCFVCSPAGEDFHVLGVCNTAARPPADPQQHRLLQSLHAVLHRVVESGVFLLPLSTKIIFVYILLYFNLLQEYNVYLEVCTFVSCCSEFGEESTHS